MVVRPGLFCPTVAPALKPPCLVVRPQDGRAPPLYLNLHSTDNQPLILIAKGGSAEGDSIFYHTDFSSLNWTHQKVSYSYRNLFTKQSDSTYYLVRFAILVQKSLKRLSKFDSSVPTPSAFL